MALGGSLLIRDSFFENNIADYDGAAIYTNSSLTIEGTTFADNESKYEGGAIT